MGSKMQRELICKSVSPCVPKLDGLGVTKSPVGSLSLHKLLSLGLSGHHGGDYNHKLCFRNIFHVAAKCFVKVAQIAESHVWAVQLGSFNLIRKKTCPECPSCCTSRDPSGQHL